MSYSDARYKKSAAYNPLIKAILGRCFIEEAPIDDDRHKGVDLLTWGLKPLRFASRVRFTGYPQFRNEFTIRCETDGQNKRTELMKFLDGEVDYFFYGFAATLDGKDIGVKAFARWYILHVPAFKKHYETRRKKLSPGYWHQRGESKFLVFDIKAFPPDPLLLLCWGWTDVQTGEIHVVEWDAEAQGKAHKEFCDRQAGEDKAAG